MVARGLIDELTFGAVSRRERPVASHIPYTRHVDDHILKTRDGLVLTVLKLDGYSFETSDINEVNARLLGRNDIVRTLGNSRFALVVHIVRREVEPKIDSTFDNAFCRELDERYDAALSTHRMFVNDIYLTLIRRPLQGKAGTFDVLMTKLLGRKDEAGESLAMQTALTELREATTAVRENLAGYGARQLGVVRRDGVWFSEPLEFLVQLMNGGIRRPMHLPRMDIADALSMKRIFFGRNAIEIRGAGPDDTRFGAMISIREYPAQTGPGSFDNLLRVPHKFIATQTFAIVDRPEAAKQIDRVSRQVDMSDEADSIVAEHLDAARDELLASEAIYGEHHMTVMCLGGTLAEVGVAVTAVGSAIWIREDLNCEPAFWAQLPGNFPYIARKAVISSKNFVGLMSLHNYPSGRANGNHWGPAISVFETTSQTAYYYNHHIRDIGNFTVVGPTGSGKTVFLSFIAAQTQRIQPRPKLVFVDKDRGAEIFIRALGGQYEVLVPGESTGFNPLSLSDTASNREFLYQLFAFMLRPASGTELTASEEQVIRNAIAASLSAGREGRTLEAFSTLLRGRIRAGEGDLLARLESWMRPDQRGWLFNNEDDEFSLSSVFGFDMTRLLDDPVIRTAALMYIFHRTESS